MNATQLQQLIAQHLPQAQVEVMSEDNVHFNAVVIWSGFAGKTLIQRQRLVLAPLQHYLNDGTIHALSLKTYTPEESTV